VLLLSGGIKSYVNDNKSEFGDGVGPLQDVNALKYTVPLIKDDVKGMFVPIEAEKISVLDTSKFSSSLIEAVISIGVLIED
jgi:hypothetical protein